MNHEHDLGLLTTIGPEVNLDWFRQTARSVKSLLCSVHWLIVVPYSAYEGVRAVLRDEDVPAFVIQREETSNLAAMRNMLALMARTEYVLTLDCDDILVPVGVDALLDRIRQTGLPWGGAAATDFDEVTSPVHPAPRPELLLFPGNTIPVDRIAEMREATRDVALEGAGSILPGATIFRRDFYLTLGGQDEVLKNWREDYVLSMYASKVSKGAWSPIPLLLWRKHAGSQTGNDVHDHEFTNAYLNILERAIDDTLYEERGFPLPLREIRKEAGL